MALKGDRHEIYTDPVHYFMNEPATRGGIVSISTAGSGSALDQAGSLVTYKANSSGALPVGILLQDMVSIDQTVQHINFYKEQVPLGSKVGLGAKGWWVTDFVAGSPTGGQYAFLASSGFVQNVSEAALNIVNTPRVGRFLSSKDQDGFITLRVDL